MAYKGSCRLLVRAWAYIVFFASLASHINRGRRESFQSTIVCIFLFVFVFLERFTSIHEFMRKPYEKLWKGKIVSWFGVFSCD
jgi:hypothetical protein